MATSTSTGSPAGTDRGTENRAQAPIRWPKADALTITCTVIWLAGLVVALVVPALMVPPGSLDAEPGQVWTAFAVSCVGAAITLFSMGYLWKRKGEAGILLLGMVPAFAAVSGGVIFATTILSTGLRR